MSDEPAPGAAPEADESRAPTKDELRARAGPAWMVLLALTLLGILMLLGYGQSIAWSKLVWIELLLLLSGACAGSVAGFLFGLPRYRAPEPPAAEGDARPADRAAALRYDPSTNLEQVSDWLTKILIGVGLVEFRNLQDALSAAGALVASSLTPPVEGAAVVSQAVLVFAAAVGFLAAYLWTRISYSEIQTRTDKRILDAVRVAYRADAVAQALASGKLVAAPAAAASARDGAVQGVAEKGERFAELLPDVRKRVLEFESKPVVHDSDPSFDLFGKHAPVSHGRRLTAEIKAEYKRALVIRLRVQRVSGEKLEGDVLFLLHPTFDERIVVGHVEDGVAEVEIYSHGWFTVAAIADKGQTVLTFDLRQMPRAPAWFKND